MTVAFSATTINPGGSATVTVTAKDAGLRPVADNTAAALIVSAGATTPVTVTTNGMATATYLAPFNTGVVTALGTVAGITGSGSTTIGPVVPVTPARAQRFGARCLACATYSTATKVAALNTYQTFKISFGAAQRLDGRDHGRHEERRGRLVILHEAHGPRGGRDGHRVVQLA